jgi:hypothetical protein
MDTLVRSGTAEPLGIKLGLSFPEEDCTGYGFKNIRSERAMREVVLATWDICSKKSINNGSTQSVSPTGQGLSPQLYSSILYLLDNTLYKLSRSMFTSSANLALIACTLLFRRSASALSSAFTV